MSSQRFASPALAALLITAPQLLGCWSDDPVQQPAAEDGPLPTELPFELSRPEAGTPPSAAETAAFTAKITGFWKGMDYFRWVSWHSHGLHASYDAAMPDYGLWWQDTVAVKEGDTITFRHQGGADNLMIRTSKVLNQAISGYMVSGDPIMRQLVIDYSKGIVALFKGMVWDNGVPETESIMARAIFTHNHDYSTDDGRKVRVDYDPMKLEEKYDWNAHTVPNPANPYYGSMWIRNMRSKDDVPHIYRIYPLLLRVLQDTQDEEVRAAAQDAVDHLRAFARDIVDNGYRIRTMEDGEAYVPPEDLASFVQFDSLVPNAECNAKLATALIAERSPLGIDCGPGISTTYEDIATSIHYFNFAIIRYFHLAAITNALATRKNAVAEKLLSGLVERVDVMMADEETKLDNPEWDADAASYLVAAAASGLPLTAAEVRLVQEQLSASADFFAPWPYWDLWDQSVPDGEYEYKPSRDGADGSRYVRPEELTYLMQYCYSPWRNPSTVELIDCEVVLDPSRWGG